MYIKHVGWFITVSVEVTFCQQLFHKKDDYKYCIYLNASLNFDEAVRFCRSFVGKEVFQMNEEYLAIVIREKLKEKAVKISKSQCRVVYHIDA